MFIVAVVVSGELWINKLISFDADVHALLGGRMFDGNRHIRRTP